MEGGRARRAARTCPLQRCVRPAAPAARPASRLPRAPSLRSPSSCGAAKPVAHSQRPRGELHTASGVQPARPAHTWLVHARQPCSPAPLLPCTQAPSPPCPSSSAPSRPSCPATWACGSPRERPAQLPSLPHAHAQHGRPRAANPTCPGFPEQPRPRPAPEPALRPAFWRAGAWLVGWRGRRASLDCPGPACSQARLPSAVLMPAPAPRRTLPFVCAATPTRAPRWRPARASPPPSWPVSFELLCMH